MTVRTYRGTEMLVAVVHARNSFGMHCYEKWPRKSFRMRSYKILKSFWPYLHNTALDCKELRTRQIGRIALCVLMRQTAPKLTPN